MSNINLEAVNNVLNNLSALRANLGNQERLVLDQLLLGDLGADEDVSAHSLLSLDQSNNLLQENLLLSLNLALDENGRYQLL